MKRLAVTALLFAAAGAPVAHAFAPQPSIVVRIDRRPDYWDRANRDWWRGRPEFSGYVGPRPGYGFAPGYGYYRIPPVYYGRRWVVGGLAPVELRRYRVIDPVFYRLRPAPRGFTWIYLGNDIALVAVSSGLIAEIVRDVW